MTAHRRRHIRSAHNRTGALLSAEALVVLPLLFAFFLAICEFGLIWAGNSRVKLASLQGCRVATLPGSDREAVEVAVERALAKPGLIEEYELRIEWGPHSGDPVMVEVELPMSAAAPDMLSAFGFDLEDRELVARTIMRRE